MNEETKQMLKDAGMQSHVDIFEIMKAGYAGIIKESGTIVDRREHPEAIQVPKNDYLGIPEPKAIKEIQNEGQGCLDN